nr:organic cation transporter protein-like [Cherax quadricarinatus]
MVPRQLVHKNARRLLLDIAVEFIGSKWRTFCGIMIYISFALGEAMTGVLAVFIRDWRWLQVAVTAPAFLLISYTWLMPESVRWLVLQGRYYEAKKIIERAARVNNVEVLIHLLDVHNVEFHPVDGTLSVPRSNIGFVNETRQEAKIKKTVIDLLRTPLMKMRSLSMFFYWVVCTLVYYGLSYNSSSLGGNIFVNFIATMLVEIPSYIFTFLVLDRFHTVSIFTSTLMTTHSLPTSWDPILTFHTHDLTHFHTH